MNKVYTFIILLFFIIPSFSNDEYALIGKWRILVAENCSETYQFMSSGKMLSSSKDEITERSYKIEMINDDQYFVTFKTIYTNKQVSCLGEDYGSQKGYEFKMVIEMNEGQNKFYMFVNGHEEYKIGPFIKE